jgi:hypothetical protein
MADRSILASVEAWPDLDASTRVWQAVHVGLTPLTPRRSPKRNSTVKAQR